MAKLKNTYAFRQSTNGKLVTVGNNRQVMNDGKFVRCYLHGHEIVTVDFENQKLKLDTCGYMTVTTRAAMNDFCGQMPVNVNHISFAGQKFNVTWNGDIYTIDGNVANFQL